MMAIDRAASASNEATSRAIALVRRIAAREQWQAHYGRTWEAEAADIVAALDVPVVNARDEGDPYDDCLSLHVEANRNHLNALQDRPAPDAPQPFRTRKHEPERPS